MTPTSTFRIVKVIQTIGRLKLLFLGIAVLHSLNFLLYRVRNGYEDRYGLCYIYHGYVFDISLEITYLIAIVGMAIIITPHICQPNLDDITPPTVINRTIDVITGGKCAGDISLMASVASSCRPVDPHELLLQEDIADQDIYHPTLPNGWDRTSTYHSNGVGDRTYSFVDSNIDDDFINNDGMDGDSGIQL
jgi:hypothetical protein